MSTLTDRVRELLRQHAPPAPLSDRDAISRLRPYGQGVQAVTANPPLNSRRPGQLAEASGARGEPVFDGVRDITP